MLIMEVTGTLLYTPLEGTLLSLCTSCLCQCGWKVASLRVGDHRMNKIRGGRARLAAETSEAQG